MKISHDSNVLSIKLRSLRRLNLNKNTQLKFAQTLALMTHICVVVWTYLYVMVLEYKSTGNAMSMLAIQMKIIVIREQVLDMRGCNGRTIAKYLRTKLRLIILITRSVHYANHVWVSERIASLHTRLIELMKTITGNISRY